MNLPQVAIFGSAARGTPDASSDFDVIAVMDGIENFDKKALVDQLTSHFRRTVSLSVYSISRLKQMWNEGSPFAWHLHLQAKPVVGFKSDFLSCWAAPAHYDRVYEDCMMMDGILKSAHDRLASSIVGCECYEAGLLYVGARNIGMFVSKKNLGFFDFTRYAPLVLHDALAFPLGRDCYDILIKARHATSRGTEVPRLEREVLVGWAWSVAHWSSNVVNLLKVGS